MKAIKSLNMLVWLLLPTALLAQQTLYEYRTAEGQALLTDRADAECGECDLVRRWTFEAYQPSSESEQVPGLRATEQLQLQQLQARQQHTQPTSPPLYQRERCNFYKQQIERVLNELSFYRGAIMTQRLRLEMLQAERMAKMYCEFPNDLITPNPDLRYAKPERYKTYPVLP